MTNLLYSAKHYQIKGSKEADRAKNEADRAKSFAESLNYDNLLNKNMITNCITEIPQDIKLELNDGTLTLKAGSKVYVPNGSGTYNAVTISSDMTLSRNSSAKYFLFLKNNGAISDTMPFSYCYSGNSQPTITHTYAIWYDTANNKIKWTNNNGSTWVDGYSLPICIVVNDTPGTQNVSSIDQVFNGFGYIGSTIFALPGVKGLIPNGRNADGSLKNIERTTSNVIMRTLTNQKGDILVGSDLSNVFGLYGPTEIVVDTVNNLNKNNQIFIAKMKAVNGVISNFNPKLPFQAVDYSDSSWVSAQAMPSGKYIDLTLGASGTEYVAPANGYFLLNKMTNGTNQYSRLRNNKVFSDICHAPASGQVTEVIVQALKGDNVEATYTAGGTTHGFRFIYAEGENS